MNSFRSRITLTALLLIVLGGGVALAKTEASRPLLMSAFVPDLPDTPYSYANIELPDHLTTNRLQNFDNTPADNPITDHGATLGRVLFYDKNLSANDTTSCASCHHQALGFSDPVQFSVGFEGGLTGRNSMGIANARFNPEGSFFWDQRAATLEDQSLLPIQDHVEMGMTLEALRVKLAAQSYYPALFENAFGSSEVTSDRIAKALSQFMRSMVSYQSKYDLGVASDFDNFTNQENRGRRIFEGRGNCADCHITDAFVLEEAENIGLDLTDTADIGLGETTGDEDDHGKFKPASLKNIALTAPYMHDGRFATLEEVVEHYNSGVQAHPNLARELRRGGQNGQPRRLNLDDDDKEALVAFLGTLTDESFTTDPKFSDPFVLEEEEEEEPEEPEALGPFRLFLPAITR